MCRICGIFEASGEAIAQRTTFKPMADTLRPDEGFYTCGGIGLAHRRLSIIGVKGTQWFRSELKEFAHEALFSRADGGLLSRSVLLNCRKQHGRGQRDWSGLLWCILMLRSWQKGQNRG